MAVKVDEILEYLNELAPLEYAEEWDNVGLLVGNRNAEVNKVYVCLDADSASIDEAIEFGCDLVVTHHPLIFGSIKQVTTDDFVQKRIYKLINSGINYIAMHTNFDVAKMSKLINEKLELADVEILDVTGRDTDSREIGIGYIGSMPEPLQLGVFNEYVKYKLGISVCGYYGDIDRPVKRIAVCPGSGKSEIINCLGRADVLVTGDIDHHSGIDALEQGLCVINAGHFEVERVFVEYIVKSLKAKYPELDIIGQELQTHINY